MKKLFMLILISLVMSGCSKPDHKKLTDTVTAILKNQIHSQSLTLVNVQFRDGYYLDTGSVYRAKFEAVTELSDSKRVSKPIYFSTNVRRSSLVVPAGKENLKKGNRFHNLVEFDFRNTGIGWYLLSRS